MRQAVARRIPGLLYQVVVLTGLFSLGYVPAQTLVPGDAAATVGRIIAAEPLFRLGIAAGLVCYTAFLLLPLTLYPRLKAHGPMLAAAMVALAAASVPIALINLRPRLDVLTLLGDTPWLATMARADVERAVMLGLASYANGLLVAKLFWGLWLLPLGVLAIRSRIVPRPLGVLLMLGCAGYLVEVFGQLLVPGYAGSALRRFITLPAALGEIGTCLWLTAFGVGSGIAPAKG